MTTRPEPTPPATPAALMAQFRDRLHGGDLDGLVGLYEPAAVFEPEPGRTVHGHVEIRAALAALMALSPRMVVRPQQVLEAGDVALVVNNWTMAGTAPDGTPVARDGRSADVLRRQPDGSWKVLIDRP